MSDLRVEMPDEPKSSGNGCVRPCWQEAIRARTSPTTSASACGCGKRWRSSLEPAGLDREAFVDVIESYGREIWLWIIGERRWEQCVEGLVGRVARRLPVDLRSGARGA